MQVRANRVTPQSQHKIQLETLDRAPGSASGPGRVVTLQGDAGDLSPVRVAVVVAVPELRTWPSARSDTWPDRERHGEVKGNSSRCWYKVYVTVVSWARGRSGRGGEGGYLGCEH